MKRAALLAAAIAVAGGVSPITRAQTPPQAVPPFRTSTTLVHIDVSVLDKTRRPVRGLAAEDFTILEDGKPQPVTAFSWVDLSDPPPVTTPWMRDVAPDVRTNTETSERRLVVIVMDDATIPFDVAMIKSAREIGRLTVESLGPNDLAAVVFTRDNRKSQEFTGDRARLLKAVESFEFGGRTIGFGGMGREDAARLALGESVALSSSVGTVSRLAEYLADVPQRRKAVVYVTVGVPADLEGAATITMAGPGAGATNELAAIARGLFDQMSDTYRRAQRANVNIYTVSPAGVGGMEQYIAAERFRGRTVPPFEKAANYFDYLVGMAENTGGRAFPDRNEFGSAITEIFRENGSYYLLGYRPPNPATDGKFRRIDVKVNRRDVTVRTRSGYYNATAKAAEAEASAAPLTTALAGLLPKSEIPLEVMAAPIAIPGRVEAGVVVVLGVHQEAAARPSRVTENVDLQIGAFTQEGTQRGAERLTSKVTLRPGPAGPVDYEVLSSITLRPGRYQLRLSVAAQQRVGSIYYDVDVPDFGALPFSMSSLLLTADPKPVSTPADRIKAFVPIVPTARREFGVNDRVGVFARIYQGSRERDALTNVQVGVKITDARGAVHLDSTQLMPKDLFGPTDRAGEFQLALPLRNLPPGPYLLTVSASSSRGTARKDVRFAVR